MKKFFEGLAVAFLLAVIVPGTKAYAADGGTIPSGVFIGPVDVSGLDVTEAETRVSAYVDEVAARQLTLHVDEGKELSFTGGDI